MQIDCQWAQGYFWDNGDGPKWECGNAALLYTFTKNRTVALLQGVHFTICKLYLKKVVKNTQTSWKFYIVFFPLL